MFLISGISDRSIRRSGILASLSSSLRFSAVSFGIQFPLMRGSTAGRDDSDYLIRILGPVRVDDYDEDDFFNHSDCLPALLAIVNSLNERHTEGIIEGHLSSLEVNMVLRFVAFIFRFVPFESRHRPCIVRKYSIVHTGTASTTVLCGSVRSLHYFRDEHGKTIT